MENYIEVIAKDYDDKMQEEIRKLKADHRKQIAELENQIEEVVFLKSKADEDGKAICALCHDMRYPMDFECVKNVFFCTHCIRKLGEFAQRKKWRQHILKLREKFPDRPLKDVLEIAKAVYEPDKFYSDDGESDSD